jgi:hypothetical protein
VYLNTNIGKKIKKQKKVNKQRVAATQQPPALESIALIQKNKPLT